jgi:hypothetical protein
MDGECLECLIGATRVEVPVADVERLVEYQAAPAPPLAQPWIGGIGLDAADDNRLFLSICLTGAGDRGVASVRGLLFRAGPSRPRWALEVDRVLGLRPIRAGATPEPVDGWVCPASWLLQAADASGEPVRFLDMDAADRALLGLEGAEARA